MQRPPGGPPGPYPPAPAPYPQAPYPQQQAYPQQQPYPYPQQPYPQQQAYPQQAYPQQQGVNGSWAADSPAEHQRSQALGNALAPSGGWGEMSRARGGIIFGLGVLLTFANLYTILETRRFYPKLLVLTPVIFFAGLFMLVVGEQKDPATGEPPGWVKLGYGVSTIGGLLLGFMMLAVVGC